MTCWVLLVFLLTGHPGVRQEILLDDPQTLAMCAIAGQQQAAQWLEEHPKWQLERVRCVPGNHPPRANNGEI